MIKYLKRADEDSRVEGVRTVVSGIISVISTHQCLDIFLMYTDLRNIASEALVAKVAAQKGLASLFKHTFEGLSQREANFGTYGVGANQMLQNALLQPPSPKLMLAGIILEPSTEIVRYLLSYGCQPGSRVDIWWSSKATTWEKWLSKIWLKDFDQVLTRKWLIAFVEITYVLLEHGTGINSMWDRSYAVYRVYSSHF